MIWIGLYILFGIGVLIIGASMDHGMGDTFWGFLLSLIIVIVFWPVFLVKLF